VYYFWSVLSLGGKVNTRQMSEPDMGTIFHIKNLRNILVIGNYYVNYQNKKKLNAFILLGCYSITDAFIIVYKPAQRKLVSICKQRIRNNN